jgi:DNA-binding transcriptional ArsR family regulator
VQGTTRAKARTIEEAVSYAIGHRIRIEILAILNEGAYSPDDLARMTGKPLSKVTHHVKELLDSRSIEIAKVERVRNMTQNFYRAVEIPFYSDEEMAAKTPEERQEIYGLVLQACMAEALASLGAGKIAEDPRAWLAWRWVNVDALGGEEIADEQAASWQRIVEIEARATSRRAESGEPATSRIVTSLGYERSRSAASTLRTR